MGNFCVINLVTDSSYTMAKSFRPGGHFSTKNGIFEFILLRFQIMTVTTGVEKMAGNIQASREILEFISN